MPKHAAAKRTIVKAKRRRTAPGISPLPLARSLRVASAYVPTSMRKKLNYVMKFSIDAGAGGTAASHFFSANSLYDPDRTTVGHQPAGFDEAMGLYDHYFVSAARISVMAMSQSATTPAANAIVSIVKRDTTSATSDVTQAVEQGAVFGLVGSASGAASQLTLSDYVRPPKYLGLSATESSLKGSSSANPSEECFFEVCVASLAGDDPPAIDMVVVIQYDATFVERKRLPIS